MFMVILGGVMTASRPVIVRAAAARFLPAGYAGRRYLGPLLILSFAATQNPVLDHLATDLRHCATDDISLKIEEASPRHHRLSTRLAGDLVPAR